MDKKIFAEAKGKVERYVGERRLRDAFALARSLSEGMANGVVSRELAGAARGAEDPARDEMTRRFGSVVLDAVDRLDRDNRKADTPTYYFNTLRYEELQGEDSVMSLLGQYAKAASEASLFNYVVSGFASGKRWSGAYSTVCGLPIRCQPPMPRRWEMPCGRLICHLISANCLWRH